MYSTGSGGRLHGSKVWLRPLEHLFGVAFPFDHTLKFKVCVVQALSAEDLKTTMVSVAEASGWILAFALVFGIAVALWSIPPGEISAEMAMVYDLLCALLAIASFLTVCLFCVFLLVQNTVQPMNYHAFLFGSLGAIQPGDLLVMVHFYLTILLCLLRAHLRFAVLLPGATWPHVVLKACAGPTVLIALSAVNGMGRLAVHARLMCKEPVVTREALAIDHDAAWEKAYQHPSTVGAME